MVNFAIVLHFHQPVGNLESVFEKVYRLCYQPFLQVLWQYPDIKMTIHISGCLLDYLEQKQPQLLELIEQMLRRGQIEIIGGGYYEPIFPAIPDRDIKGQIVLMSQYLKQRFGFSPSGMWIPERVWEPRLAGLIYDSGISYAILDDIHLLNSGINKEDSYGYFLTGEGAKRIAVFASDKMLRYLIPFKPPEATIDYFRESAQKREMLFTYGDDAEKFGEWPGTHQWVFEEQWLKKFFELLLENKAWIKLIKLSDYLKENKPLGSVNIRAGSYEEMMEWSDGSWMNFLIKYPQAKQMHKRMHYVSGKVERMAKNKNQPEKIEQAKKELYKGQCSCAYWHGVFGGLYLYHLRNAIYQHLIAAEKIADTALHKRADNWLEIKQLDLASDGKREMVVEDENFFLCLGPQEGAVLKELDYKPFSFNLINTLSRTEEPYHRQILKDVQEQKEQGPATIHDDFRKADPLLKGRIIYDKFPRFCLRNYFIKDGVGLEDFIGSCFEELGDFAAGSYRVRKINRSLILQRRSKVLSSRLRLSKKIQIKSKKEIEVLYQIKKEDNAQFQAVLGIEFNITMPDLNAQRYYYAYGDKAFSGLDAQGSTFNPDSFGICDSESEFGVKFNFSPAPLTIWYFPVQTVSQSERAYELNYQCSCIFARWKPGLGKNKSWDLKINLSVA